MWKNLTNGDSENKQRSRRVKYKIAGIQHPHPNWVRSMNIHVADFFVARVILGLAHSYKRRNWAVFAVNVNGDCLWSALDFIGHKMHVEV